jgi:glycosyltransferase involved in cell wall biosynthesis
MRCLKTQSIEVVPLGPLRTQSKWLGRLKGLYYQRFIGGSYDFQREARVAYGYASQLHSKLRDSKYEVVFSPGTIPISRLNCSQPIVIWADATFACYISHYGLDKKMSGATIRSGHLSEREAFERCALLIFSSQWAAESAIRHYGVNADKVKVVPFGANLLEPPSQQRALDSIDFRARDCCHLISIGVDWLRKGMPKAIELATILNSRGIRTTLDIVGCPAPQRVNVPDFVNVVGFIDKRTSAGEAILTRLLLRSHFHVLFSTAEAFGVAFAEANAHAVPNIANDIGGVGTSVVNGNGGQRFDPKTPLAAIADYVETHIRDYDRYSELARNSRKEYDRRLNWDVSGVRVKSYIEALISQPSGI